MCTYSMNCTYIHYSFNTAVPAESMCESLLNMAYSLINGTAGECTVSGDCLTLRCLGLEIVVIPGKFSLYYDNFVTLLPCTSPHGMLIHTKNGNTTVVSGLFTNKTVMKLNDPITNTNFTGIVEVDQQPYGITASVRTTLYVHEKLHSPYYAEYTYTYTGSMYHTHQKNSTDAVAWVWIIQI